MSKNTNMHAAKRAKNDEFYTQLTDIEKEMKHYRDHFKDKVILCNCDDPKWSNFWYYFDSNFEKLELKKLISTHYDPEKEVSYKLATYIGESGMRITTEEPIYGDDKYPPGDFRSNDCVELLKEADIVVTNPPFSLFREYVAQLLDHKKKFIVLSNMNAITYKEFFSSIKNNEIWAGYGFNLSMVYKTPYPNLLEANRKYVKSKGYDPDEGYVKVPAICWFTNLDTKKRHEELILYKTYKGNEKNYPKYDNYDAININKVSEIPKDYDGVMGVPITFLDKHNPNQFKIINPNLYKKNNLTGIDENNIELLAPGADGWHINTKKTYARIFIKRLTKIV